MCEKTRSRGRPRRSEFTGLTRIVPNQTLLGQSSTIIRTTVPSSRSSLGSVFLNGEMKEVDARLLLDNGEIRFVHADGAATLGADGTPQRLFGILHDRTNAVKKQRELEQAQKLESFGKLAGGVAHDFNNLLAVILGNLELLKEYSDERQNDEFIDAAIEATMKGAGLTKNLLAFARRAPLEPSRENLNDLVQNIKDLAGRVLSERVRVETLLADDLWQVYVDPASTESALLNLLLNARDAMTEGGEIAIETSNMRLTESDIEAKSLEFRPGDYVMLAVSDTGHGIPESDLDQVFEPFFTTKPVGEGSGLGLSMVMGFVKQSGGGIEIASEVGKGTTFRLYFKASPEDAEPVLGDSVGAEPPVDSGARILVVEDDPGVARILHRILGDAGYSITAAPSGDEGLENFRKAANPFDLVITDIVLPGSLQGPGLADAIRQDAPSIPIIFVTGFSDQAIPQEDGPSQNAKQLMKPVRRTELLGAVTKALGG